jgi:tetratricopeptide (TPR) repeat protein
LRLNGGGNKTSYKVAADFRNISGVTPRNSSNYGMLNARFDTHANSVVWFGLNANLSIGETSNPTGTAYLGSPSYMLAMRDKALSPDTTADQWLQDYDDDSMDYRGLLSTYLVFNIIPNLSLRLEGGVDLQANDRVIWYGKSTDLGKVSADNTNGGAASNLTSDLFSYNAKASLDYKFFFLKNHSVGINASGEILGNRYHFNTLNGINFASHDLRGKGLNLRASLPLNHIFRYSYSHFGASGTLAYSWDGKVGLDGSFRYDGTPKYAHYSEAMYPAGEVYVDIHRIAFPQDRNVSSLRLKGGYGVSGREQYIPYGKFGKYLSGEWYRPEKGQEGFCDGVDNLRTSEWHVTGQVGFLQERVRAELTFYDRKTSDRFTMYSFASEPSVTSKGTFYDWIKVPDVMFGRESVVSNRGFELEIDAAKNARLHANMGNIYFNEKKYISALKEYEIAFNLAHKTQAAGSYLYNIARCYFVLGEYDLSKKAVLGAIQKDCIHITYYQLLVDCFIKLDIVENELQKHIEDESNPYNRIIVGLIYLKTNRETQARAILDDFIVRYPKMIIVEEVKAILRQM